MTLRASKGRPVRAVVLALGVLALAAAGCRAHTQELVLDQAAQDFFAPKVLCSETLSVGSETSTGVTVKEVPIPVSDTGTTRDHLVPWIVGPNQYVVEGCHHQARYRCDSVACRREGPIEDLRTFVTVKATPAQIAAAEEAPTAPAPGAGGLTPASTQDNGADAEALRAALEARRAELASCVDHLPLGVKVEYAPGAAPVVTLRGNLQGKPEEGCVRAVLKDLKSMSFKSAGTVIHVVK